MNIQEYKKLAINKIEADALTKQVRDVIKITKWQKQDAREGFKETFKPLIKCQDSIKKSIDEQQDSLIKQLQANQLALTRLCIKVGRGQGDGDFGTRVWGLGTYGRETRDLRTSSVGRGDVWDGDAGTSNTGTQRTRDVNNYCKSRR